MYKGQRITVIIPCLNEEHGIEKILRSMPDLVDETIVVDNNSTDRTAEVARSLGAKVIREEVRGYGRSYKRGFANATGDLIITLDGEHSYPVDALSPARDVGVAAKHSRWDATRSRWHGVFRGDQDRSP